MTNVIDFEEAWLRPRYEQDREKLRPYYGDKVDDFDWGDLDELVGMLRPALV